MIIRIYSRGVHPNNSIYLRGVHPDLLKRGHPDINNRYIFKVVQSIQGLYFTLIYLKRGFTMTIRIYSRGVHPNNRYLLKGGSP